MKIRKIDGVWHCAEVVSVAPTRYGEHRFYVRSRVDKLDKNIVAAPFLYRDDAREIDLPTKSPMFSAVIAHLSSHLRRIA